MKRIIFSVFAFLLSTSLLAQTPSSAEWTIYGKKIKAPGVVKMKTIDEKVAKHWAEEQSNPAVKPEDIKGAQNMYIMTASGVVIEKGGAISKEQQDVIDGKKKKEGH